MPHTVARFRTTEDTTMNKNTLRPVAFVLTSTNHGTMLVNRHDYRLVGNSGFGVGYQILNTSSFDQSEIDLAVQLIELRKRNFGPGVVAIDCGANIGAHTIEWAKYMAGWGEVLAFEAQERIFYALAGNITLNNCFNARAIWAAVGSSAGSIGVPVPDYFKPSSFGSLEIRKTAKTEFIGQEIDYSDDKLRKTQMVAIDDYNLPRLDFLKIDIEGMEMEALNGARKTIARTKPIMLIERIKTSNEQMNVFLHEHGYRINPLGMNTLAIHESDPTVNQITVQVNR